MRWKRNGTDRHDVLVRRGRPFCPPVGKISHSPEGKASDPTERKSFVLCSLECEKPTIGKHRWSVLSSLWCARREGPSVRRLASLVDSRVIVKSGPHLFVWCTSCVVMWYIGCPFPFPFTFSFRLPPTRWRTRKLPRGAAAPEVQGVGAGPYQQVTPRIKHDASFPALSFCFLL
ncbi:hypothetical protein PVAP13_9KG618600 [Panicum virgatum]|nr:hypothetical protein PVAP13_9KG618600 [Panicum virgatum]